MRHRVSLAVLLGSLSLTSTTLHAETCPPAANGCDQTIELSFLGRYASGLYDAGGAEIAAYDAASKRLFVINNGVKRVDILDAANPAAPTLITSLDTSGFGGGGPNSVAVKNGIVAVAVESSPKTNPGTVVFYDVFGSVLASVPVGALPDMLTFTPDGTKVLVANEGEPASDYAVDPAGSVSVIDLSKGVRRLSAANVTTIDLAAAASIDAEVSVKAPNATLTTDLEPEYITISEDGLTAWVTLQEANAVAILDIPTATCTAIRWLGRADHGRGTPVLTTATLQNPPSIGTTAAGQSIALGGFSGLFFDSIDASTGKVRFITHTDRGPNGEPVNVDGDPALERMFALPDFQPRLAVLDFDPATQSLSLVDQILLKNADGSPLSGRPNILGQSAGLAYTDEEPVDVFGQPIPLDPTGLDLEGIVRTPDGSWWMGDEYRPSIVRFAADGTMLARYVPEGSNAFGATTGIEALPAVYAQRRANRGFEAIAQYDGMIYVWIQSPIDNPDVANDASSKASKSVRILQFDPATETVVAEYLYRQEGSGSDKIGDAVAIAPGKFLVVERDDGTGPNAKKKIFEIDLDLATDISTLPPSIAGPGGTLELMTPAQLEANGIAPVSKTLVVDLAAIGYTAVADKVEGLAMIDRSRLAVIGDNDFQMQGTFNPATGLLTPNPNPLASVLGVITFAGHELDPSDQDGGIKIASWPVFGNYRPDAIASLRVAGTDYLVTANEGDSREYSAYNELTTVANAPLDPNAFPNRTWLKANARLGRLQIIKDRGDLDGDGDLDEINAFGSRSMSVRGADGSLLWDSGPLMEKVTAAVYPANFNASNTSNTFDGRSRSKGPEPEGVAVGDVGGVPYAFVALERIGGVMTFNLESPAAPVYEQYLNTRNFAAAPSSGNAGDLGPEGVLFVAADESPIDAAMLVVANEISGTVSFFAVEPLCGSAPGDLVPDCVIDGADLGELLGAWGACNGCSADLNADGTVDGADLAILLGAWS